MTPEGRALEAEAAPIERPHFSFDNHLRRELTPTGDAHEPLRLPRDRLAWPLERPVRATLQAVLATTEVASPTIELDFYREGRSADYAPKHPTDRTWVLWSCQ